MVSEDQNPISPNDSVKTVAAKWLFGQEANTVALYLILASLGYFTWYMVNTGIPKHLDQIHRGYTEINDANNKARTEAQATFDKTLDRIEKVYQAKKTGATEGGN